MTIDVTGDVTIDALVLTCEHGGNRVPARYAERFASRRARRALASHRGHDIGALPMARYLRGRLDAPLIYSTISRLLVELNRSIGHPGLFSEFTARLPAPERERLLRRYYHPHRQRVEAAIAAHVERGHRVLHLGVHSFTPRLHGVTRTADVALLYDPGRAAEKQLGARWKAALCELRPDLRVRRNYPYRGKDDGLTTYLRRRFDADAYLGVELETNQALLTGDAAEQRRLVHAVGESLRVLLR